LVVKIAGLARRMNRTKASLRWISGSLLPISDGSGPCQRPMMHSQLLAAPPPKIKVAICRGKTNKGSERQRDMDKDSATETADRMAYK